MIEQKHAHEVMQMMIDDGISYTKESLEKKVIEQFGKNTSFFACSAEDMDAKELVEFLERKGKFIPKMENGFTVDPSTMCNH